MKKLTLLTLTLLLTALAQLTAPPVQAEVSIPDANLAEAIRDALGLPPGAAITSDAMLNLTSLDASGSGIANLTGLEYATQLERLSLDDTDVSDISALANLTQLERLSLDGTDVSDVSALAHLTQLKTLLDLSNTDVSDVSALAHLTQLKTLYLDSTDVSGVSALANLTQLKTLNLQNCPLNAASHQVHIPAIQANGTEVRFDPFKPIHLPRAPWLVSLIYFRPSDIPVRPNVDAEIDALIKKAQRFFADQLELHGFGRKTFQFETDAHGNAVVHHVNGKFPRMDYVNNEKYKQEIKGQIYISQKKSVTV